MKGEMGRPEKGFGGSFGVHLASGKREEKKAIANFRVRREGFKKKLRDKEKKRSEVVGTGSSFLGNGVSRRGRKDQQSS